MVSTTMLRVGPGRDERSLSVDRSMRSRILRSRRTRDDSPISCSQIRITCHPFLRRIDRPPASLWRFASIFADQNAALFFGRVECRGHPCQKHPSTKTAIRAPWKTKSGRIGRHPSDGDPVGIGIWRRHPRMPSRRKTLIMASSVERLPRLRILDMSSLRRDFEMISPPGFPPFAGFLRACPGMAQSSRFHHSAWR